MKKIYELGMREFPCITLTAAETATLTRASGILERLRGLAGDEDDTADTDLGRADAALVMVVRDLNHGRFIP